MSERLYPQCGNHGQRCTVPACGPPYCLPDGSFTQDPLAAARALQATRNTQPDFAALNAAAAREMRRRSPQAAEAHERARLAVPSPPWEVTEGERPDVGVDMPVYPSQAWRRESVADVRYPGLTRRLPEVRRFQLETPAYRRQFGAVNRLMCATLITVPPVSWVLTNGQSATPMAAAMIGLTVATIGAVRMLLFVTRQRHTA